MSVYIMPQPFDPWQSIAAHQNQAQLGKQMGATAIFVGTMRDINNHQPILQMTLEYYPEMTARYLANIKQQAQKKWPLLDSLIIHRVGTIYPADTITLIACWSVHRHSALAACNWLLENLKYHAPFWKKEVSKTGSYWLSDNPHR